MYIYIYIAGVGVVVPLVGVKVGKGEGKLAVGPFEGFVEGDEEGICVGDLVGMKVENDGWIDGVEDGDGVVVGSQLSKQF